MFLAKSDWPNLLEILNFVFIVSDSKTIFIFVYFSVIPVRK